MAASGYSSWPTPTVHEAGTLNRSASGGPPQNLAVSAREWGRNWQTPNAAAEAPNLWLTPKTHDDGSSVERFRERMIERGARAHQFSGLTQQAEHITRNWPTPQAHDSVGGKTPEQVEEMRARTGAGVWNLNEESVRVTRNWQTPSANEDAAGTLNGNMQHMLSHQAQEWAYGEKQIEAPTGAPSSGRPVPRTMRDGLASLLPDDWISSRLRLNPAFVEWLMGWPEGWTSLVTSRDLTASTSLATA